MDSKEKTVSPVQLWLETIRKKKADIGKAMDYYGNDDNDSDDDGVDCYYE